MDPTLEELRQELEKTHDMFLAQDRNTSEFQHRFLDHIMQSQPVRDSRFTPHIPRTYPYGWILKPYELVEIKYLPFRVAIRYLGFTAK